MRPATLNLAGRKYVVIPQSEYRLLKARATRNGSGVKKKRRLTRQDRGDIAESIRRLATEKSIPIDQVARELGFDPAELRG